MQTPWSVHARLEVGVNTQPSGATLPGQRDFPRIFQPDGASSSDKHNFLQVKRSQVVFLFFFTIYAEAYIQIQLSFETF